MSELSGIPSRPPIHYNPSAVQGPTGTGASHTATAATGPAAAPLSQDQAQTSSLGSASPQLLFAESGGLAHPDVQRLQAALNGASPEELQTLLGDVTGATPERLQALLKNPNQIANSLNTILSSRELGAQARAAIESTIKDLATALETLNSGDTQGFLSALNQSVSLGNFELSLADTLSHVERAIQLEQSMADQDARHTVPALVNQAFTELNDILASGRAQNADQLEQLLVGRLQLKSDVQQRQFVSQVATGSVQEEAANLRSRFQQRMQTVPGYAQAVVGALNAVEGFDPHAAASAGPGFLGQLSIDQLQAVQRNLSAQLAGLEANPSPESEALAQALRETLDKDLPGVLEIKQNYTAFRSMMGHHVQKLGQDIQHIARETGLDLPAGLALNLQRDPLNAESSVQQWLGEQRMALADDPKALHALDSIELFALQLKVGVGIVNRVERGERIDAEILESYERFQTFVLAKNALALAYEQSEGERAEQLREMLFSFGSEFNQWMQLDQEAFRQAALGFAENFADADTLQEMTQIIENVLFQLRSHNRNVDCAQRDGVELTAQGMGPARIKTHEIVQPMMRRLGELARDDSAYYQEVYQRGGDSAMREALQNQQDLILVSMIAGLAALGQAQGAGASGNVQDKIKLEARSDKIEQATEDGPLDAVMKRLRTGLNDIAGPHLGSALQEIISSIRADLEAVRQEKQLIQAAAKARKALSQQLFELNRQMSSQEARFHREKLEELDTRLKESIDALGSHI